MGEQGEGSAQRTWKENILSELGHKQCRFNFLAYEKKRVSNMGPLNSESYALPLARQNHILKYLNDNTYEFLKDQVRITIRQRDLHTSGIQYHLHVRDF